MQNDNEKIFHSMKTIYGREKEISFSFQLKCKKAPNNKDECISHLIPNEITQYKIKNKCLPNSYPNYAT